MQTIDISKNIQTDKTEMSHGFKGNLVDNHLVRILSSLLKGYISFVIEVPLEHQLEVNILKGHMPECFSYFNDVFCFNEQSERDKISSNIIKTKNPSEIETTTTKS